MSDMKNMLVVLEEGYTVTFRCDIPEAFYSVVVRDSKNNCAITRFSHLEAQDSNVNILHLAVDECDKQLKELRRCQK
jgi:hypothetical protein